MKGKIFTLVLFLLTLKCFADEKGYGVYAAGEFLWWKGVQSDLCYATTGVLLQPGTTLSSSGKVHSVDYPWKPGFRIGLGFHTGHDCWDIYSRYTYFHSSSTDRAQNAEGNMLPIATTINGITSASVNGVTTARSSWNLSSHVVDLELGRKLSASKFLNVRLFMGLRGTWIDQDWNTRYTSNQITLDGGDPLPGTITTRQDHDTWGIGIRMGINGTWTIFKGFSIVSDVSFSGIWSDYDISRRDNITQTGVGLISRTNIKDDPDRVIANIEMMLGLQRQWWFNKERYRLSLQAGWENQVWIHYGHFIFLRGSSSGDLSFSGLSAKLRFDF